MVREAGVRKAEEPTERIAKLSPPQQALAEQLVRKLETCSFRPTMTLDQVIDEFEREHREVLQLLASAK
jgi:hypothetical protein